MALLRKKKEDETEKEEEEEEEGLCVCVRARFFHLLLLFAGLRHCHVRLGPPDRAAQAM